MGIQFNAGQDSTNDSLIDVELGASASTIALGGVKTTVVTLTASGAQDISLGVGTSSKYGRWFLTHNSVDIDERWSAPQRTVKFDFGEGLFHLDDTDTLDIKFQSPSTETNTADVNATIYKAV